MIDEYRYNEKNDTVEFKEWLNHGIWNSISFIELELLYKDMKKQRDAYINSLGDEE